MSSILARAAVPGWLVVALMMACADPLAPPPRDTEAPIQTDRLSYRLEPDGDRLITDIAYTYTNDVGEAVFVANCNGIAPPSLQKRVAGRWVHAWSPVVPLCLSEPIVIRDGERFSGVLRVDAGRRGSEAYPEFDVDEVDGVYRLVWPNVVRGYDPDRNRQGEILPLDDRISNEFVLSD